jgi:hypothetical protein
VAFLVRLFVDKRFLKRTLREWGVLAPVIFIGLQALQVIVALIPGEVRMFLPIIGARVLPTPRRPHLAKNSGVSGSIFSTFGRALAPRTPEENCMTAAGRGGERIGVGQRTHIA